MGIRRGIYIRPGWTANLGALIEADILVRAVCDICKDYKDVDLRALAEKVGLEFDLWNRRPRCSFTEGCCGRVLFLHSGRGVMRPMQDPERTAWLRR